MTKDVNVTISPWGGMLFPLGELRATLTYLSYKVGLPVLFEPLELREVREGSFSPGPADAVHVCVLRDEEGSAEGVELPVCLEGRGYSLRAPSHLSLELWTPWSAKCVRDHSVGSLGVPLAVVFAHYVVFLVDFTQGSGDGAQAVLRHVIEQAVGMLDLTAARELQEQRLAELEAVLAPWFREAVKHEQFELEGRIGRLKNSVAEAVRVLVDGERELPVLEGELTFLRAWAAEPRDGRVEAEVGRLKQLVQGGFYREISVRSDAICGRTHPIVIDHDGYEFARLYALRPTDLDAVGFYETNLYSSEEAEPLPCSGRSIVYCPTVIGGMIAALIARHVRGEHVPLEMLVDLRSFQLLWS